MRVQFDGLVHNLMTPLDGTAQLSRPLRQNGLVRLSALLLTHASCKERVDECPRATRVVRE